MDAIAEGATSFLVTEYKYMGVFMAFFSVFIFVLLSSEDGFSTAWHLDKKTGIERAPALYNGAFSTLAFFVGAATSILSGFLGMKIATFANARTALEARKGIAPAFMCAFRAGAVMGFTLAGLGLVVLSGLIFLFRAVYGDDWVGCYEALTGELVVAEGSPLSFSFFGVEREREAKVAGREARNGAEPQKKTLTHSLSLSLSLSLFLLFLSLSPSSPLPLSLSPFLPLSFASTSHPQATALAAPQSRSSVASAAASTPRPPTSAPTSSARSRRTSRRMTRATRP